MQEGAGKAIKTTLAVLAVVGCSYLVYRSFTSEEKSDQPDNINYYKCAECGEVQQIHDSMVPNIKHKILQNGQVTDRHAGKSRGMIPIYVIECPKCKKFAARTALKCPRCNEVFVDRDDNGAIRACPKCSSSQSAANSPQG